MCLFSTYKCALFFAVQTKISFYFGKILKFIHLQNRLFSTNVPYLSLVAQKKISIYLGKILKFIHLQISLFSTNVAYFWRLKLNSTNVIRTKYGIYILST